MELKKIRYYIFLKDVAWLSLTAFGGPQVHIAMFINTFVKKRGYLKEADFMELNALCQILPGPTSTQTIVALGFKIGGSSLAYLTLLVWCFPAVAIMTIFGLALSYFDSKSISLEFMRFVQPMAIGFVWYAAFKISKMVVSTRLGLLLMLTSTIVAYKIQTPWVFPIVVVFGGLITSFNFKKQPKTYDKKIKVQWGNFILFWAVLIVVAILGGITNWLPLRLFENFYRNGSFIFGGGQVLIPVLLTEFVTFKGYLSEDEFLSGYGLAQFVPGPVFSFTAFIGVLSMREYGLGGEILGGLIAAIGIFLPGVFLIFFVIRFWEDLKKYRVIKASLEGIQAASSGLVIAAGILLFQSLNSGVNLDTGLTNLFLVCLTFILLQFTKVSQPVIISLGLLLGVIYQFAF